MALQRSAIMTHHSWRCTAAFCVSATLCASLRIECNYFISSKQTMKIARSLLELQLECIHARRRSIMLHLEWQKIRKLQLSGGKFTPSGTARRCTLEIPMLNSWWQCNWKQRGRKRSTVRLGSALDSTSLQHLSRKNHRVRITKQHVKTIICQSGFWFFWCWPGPTRERRRKVAGRQCEDASR